MDQVTGFGEFEQIAITNILSAEKAGDCKKAVIRALDGVLRGDYLAVSALYEALEKTGADYAFSAEFGGIIRYYALRIEEKITGCATKNPRTNQNQERQAGIDLLEAILGYQDARLKLGYL